MQQTNTVTHNHKLVKITNCGRDKGQYVVSQRWNAKCCSLIAIFNIFLLRGDIVVDRTLNPTISDDFMVKSLQDYLNLTLNHIKAWIPTLKTSGLRTVKNTTDATMFLTQDPITGENRPEVQWIKGLFAIALTLCRSIGYPIHPLQCVGLVITNG
jgi:hypothetical protein